MAREKAVVPPAPALECKTGVETGMSKRTDGVGVDDGANSWLRPSSSGPELPLRPVLV